MTKRTNYEKETIVLFNEADQTAQVTAYAARLKRRLVQLAADRPSECKIVKRFSDGSIDCEIPKDWIRINPPREAAPLTEEQRGAKRETIRKINSKPKNTTSTTTIKDKPPLGNTPVYDLI